MADAETTRRRILEGAYAGVAREGVGAMTMEAAAREAGVARATVYRHFPGGREELKAAVVSWEVGQFLQRVVDDAAGAGDFAGWMVEVLAAGRRRLDQHAVLNDVLRTDAGELMPPLATAVPLAVGLLHRELATRLGAGPPQVRLRPGVQVERAADLLARLMVSFMGTPGCWPLEEPGALDRLVRGHLLAGVIET